MIRFHFLFYGKAIVQQYFCSRTREEAWNNWLIQRSSGYPVTNLAFLCNCLSQLIITRLCPLLWELVSSRWKVGGYSFRNFSALQTTGLEVYVSKIKDFHSWKARPFQAQVTSGPLLTRQHCRPFLCLQGWDPLTEVRFCRGGTHWRRPGFCRGGTHWRRPGKHLGCWKTFSLLVVLQSCFQWL